MSIIKTQIYYTYFFIMKNLKIFLTFIMYFLFYHYVNAWVKISSILPNTSDDANLEYIEIYNSWEELNIWSYILQDKSWKQYTIPLWEHILAWEKKKYYRTITKIILNNTNEEVFLYNNSWELIDSYSFSNSEKDTVIEVVNNSTIETKIEIPDVEIDVQSWLNYLYWNLWECPEKATDICKINLNVENIFSWLNNKSDYECEWDFWNALKYSQLTKTKCNPWYVEYWEWVFWIIVKVIEKNNISNYKIWTISIQNIEELEIESSNESNNIKSKENKNVEKEPKGLKIKSPEIIIQSWLNEKNECSNKKNCLVNFKYNPNYYNKIKCYWDFGWGIYAPWSNQKCDPRTVKYSYWEYYITLKVSERKNKDNYKISKLKITNKEIKKQATKQVVQNKIQKLNINKQKYSHEVVIEENSTDKFVIENKNKKEKQEKKIEKKEEIVNQELVTPIITVQWKIWTNKILENNKITCIDGCSINFDWRSSFWDIKKYIWDFWNWEKFEWANPWYIKYTTNWSYRVNLTTFSEKWNHETASFNVFFPQKEKVQKIEKNKTNENISSTDFIKAENEYKKWDKETEEIKGNNIKHLELLFYIILFLLTINLVIIIIKKEKFIN